MPATFALPALPLAEIAAAHLQAFRTLCALAADLTNPAQARLAATTLLSIALPDTAAAALPSTSPERSDGPKSPPAAFAQSSTSPERSDGPKSPPAAFAHSSTSPQRSDGPSHAPGQPLAPRGARQAQASPVATTNALDRYLARSRGPSSPAARLMARATAGLSAAGTG